jgi:hypothetical protein
LRLIGEIGKPPEAKVRVARVSLLAPIWPSERAVDLLAAHFSAGSALSMARGARRLGRLRH